MEASVDLRQSLDAKRGDRVLSLGKAQQIPDVGDEIAIVRTGISRRGRVCYADQLQILVKWTTADQAACWSEARASRSSGGRAPIKHTDYASSCARMGACGGWR
jgi:hypothetical protein